MTTQKELSPYVTLVSCDKHSFVVRRSAVQRSGMLRRMLDPRSGFSESISGTCNLDIPGIVLEKVCEYFCYHEKYRDVQDCPEMDIPVELCMELLVAAYYLDT
ncbi:MAG: hypothetical protein M1832_003678 [Thelocarpon impressellum]|nr:MAG: hypothetical protein M1832_003678 [Thelocarpon impressellum]